MKLTKSKLNEMILEACMCYPDVFKRSMRGPVRRMQRKLAALQAKLEAAEEQRQLGRQWAQGFAGMAAKKKKKNPKFDACAEMGIPKEHCSPEINLACKHGGDLCKEIKAKIKENLNRNIDTSKTTYNTKEFTTMKLTKTRLKRLIKKELKVALREQFVDDSYGDEDYSLRRLDEMGIGTFEAVYNVAPTDELLANIAACINEDGDANDWIAALNASDDTKAGELSRGCEDVFRQDSPYESAGLQEKLTKSKLKQIIQEELKAVLNEQTLDDAQRKCIIDCINEEPDAAVMQAFKSATSAAAAKTVLENGGFKGCWTCVTDN